MKPQWLSSTSVKKGMPPKEIQEDCLETLGKESPYSTVKNGQQSLRGGERALRMMDGLTFPKDATADENVKVVHTLVMCDR